MRGLTLTSSVSSWVLSDVGFEDAFGAAGSSVTLSDPEGDSEPVQGLGILGVVGDG